MTTKQKRKAIKVLADEMLKDSYKHMKEKIDKALDSGAVSVDDWDPNNAPMVVPKCIIAAVLEDEATQYTARGTGYERKIRKGINNIKYFI
jgi:ribosomal protein L17